MKKNILTALGTALFASVFLAVILLLNHKSLHFGSILLIFVVFFLAIAAYSLCMGTKDEEIDGEYRRSYLRPGLSLAASIICAIGSVYYFVRECLSITTLDSLALNDWIDLLLKIACVLVFCFTASSAYRQLKDKNNQDPS